MDETSTPVVIGPRKVRRACTVCHMMKKKCDEARPCQRCVNRGIADDCKDRDEVVVASTPPPSAPHAAVVPVVTSSTCSFSSSFANGSSSGTAGSSSNTHTGFWEQFRTAMTDDLLDKAIQWHQKYSPMYLHEMTEANSISRRKYLNFIKAVSRSKDTMSAVLDDILQSASLVGDVSQFANQPGIPYETVKVKTQFMNEQAFSELSAVFLGVVCQLWPEVTSYEIMAESLCLYQFHLQEQWIEAGECVCNVLVEFNECFKRTMNTSLEFIDKAIRNDLSKVSFRLGNPSFWIFDQVHWDVVMDFSLMSFFNQCNLMKGTFKLSNWDEESKIVLQDDNDGDAVMAEGGTLVANMVAFSHYDETYSQITYTFGFRLISL
eukprot:TRINITY_DN2421_c0_g1_i1.p1 TRINITY_DN2421_c0_g1~~TRINITY_DN2421_c0_g1_i1.p1  ORF type:complete len:385 (-),score=76.68 TRINITY_DN2421_c0_g1_i1:550-1680(-)